MFHERMAKTMALLAVLACAPAANALNIVLTNDDGFEASTTYALYQRLRAAGHSVIISAATQDNSGKGGALDFLRPITPLTRDTRAGFVKAGAPGTGVLTSDPDIHYVDSTPVATALYGIEVAAIKKWGKAPDLLISGPNYGNNTGIVNNGSGTVNAALISINIGIPAIAVSSAHPISYKSFDKLAANDPEYEVADIVVRLVNQLDRRKKLTRGQLLPTNTGLNVNIPGFEAGSAANLPMRFSREGLATIAIPVFVPDLSKDPVAKAYGVGVPYPGVTLYVGGVPPANAVFLDDDNPGSEQNVVNAGKIAISVIKGNHQAGIEVETAVRLKLIDMVEWGRD